MPTKTPSFLVDLLNARSPSGYETEAQAVIDKYVQETAEAYQRDAMGNRLASINLKGSPTLMLAGHMDELGLSIKHVNKDGFLFFDPIGGHDHSLISGRRVTILTKNGPVKGVTGKQAIHLMDLEERKTVPKLNNMWIDIGAENKKAALEKVRIGDAAVYDQSFEIIDGDIAVARAFDNKIGAYLVCETLRRLAQDSNALSAKVTAVATTQEEVGCRGVVGAAYAASPEVAIAVDVGHATDYPGCSSQKHGEYKLGKGPIICRGPNINPLVFEQLITCAEQEKIPYQIESSPGPTGTDARSIQISRQGVATGLLSIPLRYMHTPSELAHLNDVEDGVRLLTAFARSLKADQSFLW